MSDPTKLGFDLVPNNPEDDPRIHRAVELHIRRELERRGLRVPEAGCIPPDAAEDAERAERIAARANTLMEKATTESRKRSLPAVDLSSGHFQMEESVRRTDADGIIEERSLRVSQSIRRIRVNLDALQRLISAAVNLADWARKNAEALWGVFIGILGADSVTAGAPDDESAAIEAVPEDDDDDFPASKEDRD